MALLPYLSSSLFRQMVPLPHPNQRPGSPLGHITVIPDLQAPTASPGLRHPTPEPISTRKPAARASLPRIKVIPSSPPIGFPAFKTSWLLSPLLFSCPCELRINSFSWLSWALEGSVFHLPFLTRTLCLTLKFLLPSTFPYYVTHDMVVQLFFLISAFLSDSWFLEDRDQVLLISGSQGHSRMSGVP